MAKQSVTGPHQVTEEDIERSSTLDGIDFGAWYILINGSMQFCESEQSARSMKSMLEKLV